MLLSCAEEVDDQLPPGFTGEVSEAIRLNQVGIYPETKLRFSVVTFSAVQDSLAPATAPDKAKPDVFYVTAEGGKVIIEEGELGELKDWTSLGGVKAYHTVTSAPAIGSYRIFVPGYGYSHEFEVKRDVYREALIASLRSNYLQRMGVDLSEEHAGVYARKAGHPDTRVKFHPSTGRSGYTSSPGGWYDAGDYNKYVVNGAFPTAQYLSLFEEVGPPLKDGDLNIPESGNGISDYLDEIRYELDWLLTMQDRDGGAFHKVTTLAFGGMEMPEKMQEQRYMVGKSTEATLDLAGALAQASRVYVTVDPPFAARMIAAAEKAWDWAEQNPATGFTNPEDVSTGQYGDTNWRDEKAFAAMELYVSTQREKYLEAYLELPPDRLFKAGGGWKTFMGKLAMFTILRFPDKVPVEVYESTRLNLIETADSLVKQAQENAFGQPITSFHWGSNSDVLNAAMLVAVANQVGGKPAYRDMILAAMDYLLGHNATGYSFVTGFGDKTPMFIHHRPSIADGIAEPFPGFVSGGPNPGRQDSEYTTYPPNAAPMQSWADQEGSFASNEICLNWNAPLTFVLGYLEATR